MEIHPVLETRRLLLRVSQLSDASQIRQLANDRAIADTTMNIPHPYEEGMAEEWISETHTLSEEGTLAPFVIVLKEDDRVIGAISLKGIDHDHSHAELGYWIGRPFWNNGYATEAGKAILNFAFQELGLYRVHAHHLSRNPSSGRVLEKLGMKHEGHLRQHIRKWEILEDIDLFGVLADGWDEQL